MREKLAVRAYNGGVNSLQRQNVADLSHDAFLMTLGEETLIVLPVSVRGRITRFAIWSMVDKGADRNPGCELRSTTDVIIMVVRNQHVIDFADTGLFGSGDDTV